MTQSLVLANVARGSGADVRGSFNTADRCLVTQNSGPSAPTVTYEYMLWRDSTTKSLYMRDGTNAAWLILEKRGAVSNPTTGDDSVDGFQRGSFWVNETGNQVWCCVNPAAEAAVWIEIAGGGGGGGGSVTSVFGRSGSVTATIGDYNAAQITETTSAKILTSAERTKLAAINTYWASRTAADPAAGVKNVWLGAHDLRRLLIYWGLPYSMDGKNDPDYAAGNIAWYDDVVLGYGLQDSAGGNYSSTVSIISKAKALNPNLTIYGNIDCGVSGGTSHNHTTGTLSTHITQWVTAGANGIFCDNFGYDFGVSRARQNTVIDAIHAASLPAMLFAVTIDDALSSTVNTTYNPSGTATHADSRDAYLCRWLFNSDLVASPYFDAYASVKSRGDAMRTFRLSTGVRMYADNILTYSGQGQTVLDSYRGISKAMAHIFRLNGSTVSQALHSASGTDANKVSLYYPKIVPQPGGRLTAPYNTTSTSFTAPDLGIVVTYASGNYTWSAPGPAVVSTGGGTAPADSGLIPAVTQTANGNAPNAEKVWVKGSCSQVYLLVVATQRHAQVFHNATASTVTFTSSEGITDYPSGFGLPTGQSVNFIRDPDNNLWKPW